MYEQYTDKQIVEMLKPKLEKLGWGNVVNNDLYPDTVKMIATIYRSGYIRGQLGRSFVIGEKKAKEPVNTFKVGDEVKFLGLSIEDEGALSNRRFYPPVGTIGQIMETGGVDYCFVQWPYGITSGDGVWACRNKYLEKIKERWVPATKTNLKPGVKVRFLNALKHEYSTVIYPEPGTVGEVMKVCLGETCRVQWPCFSTSLFVRWSDLEVLLCE